MNTRYEKFRISLQAPVRLEIALEDFFLPELPEEYRNAYRDYLSRRIVPAVQMLISRDEDSKLTVLAELGMFPDGELDRLLQQAVREQRDSCTLWLLRQKARTVGFSGRHFPLEDRP